MPTAAGRSQGAGYCLELEGNGVHLSQQTQSRGRAHALRADISAARLGSGSGYAYADEPAPSQNVRFQSQGRPGENWQPLVGHPRDFGSLLHGQPQGIPGASSPMRGGLPCYVQSPQRSDFSPGQQPQVQQAEFSPGYQKPQVQRSASAPNLHGSFCSQHAAGYPPGYPVSQMDPVDPDDELQAPSRRPSSAGTRRPKWNSSGPPPSSKAGPGGGIPSGLGKGKKHGRPGSATGHRNATQTPVGNFLRLLGIGQYSQNFMDLGLESLESLSGLEEDDLFGVLEQVPFFPGHKAKLIRGTQVLREAALIGIRENASKGREEKTLIRLCQRNEILAEDLQKLAFQQEMLREENQRLVHELAQSRSQNVELEKLVRTQADQVGFLAEKLQRILVGGEVPPEDVQRSAVPHVEVQTQIKPSDVKATKQGMSVVPPLPIIAQLSAQEAEETPEAEISKEAPSESDYESSFEEDASPQRQEKGSNGTPSPSQKAHAEASDTDHIVKQCEEPAASATGMTTKFVLVARCLASALVNKLLVQGEAAESQVEEECKIFDCTVPNSAPNRLDILEFIIDLFHSFSSSSAELAVLVLVYLDRFTELSSVKFSPQNWRRLVFSSVVLASKVWYGCEAFSSTELAQLSPLFSYTEIQKFEQVFLRCLGGDLLLAAEDYERTRFLLESLTDASERSAGNGLFKVLDVMASAQLRERSVTLQASLLRQHFQRAGLSTS